MSDDAENVIVTSDDSAQFRAHHRNFPEARADGESPRAAAANLVQDLERELEAASDDLHRRPIREAIADVRAFIERPD